jgi:hypothetical protein
LALRTKVYKTKRLGKGRRIVTSGKVSDFFAMDIISFCFKAIFFCMFFWIIIPVKLLRKK